MKQFLSLLLLVSWRVSSVLAQPCTATITPGGPTTFCPGGSVTLTANSGNVWTQKTDFGGAARGHAVAFSIGNKGYIGTGTDAVSKKNDFWEYDPSTNIWTQKADFGGTARQNPVGFSIGTKGYIGTGLSGVNVKNKDFWEYDPSTNIWTRKTDFGGTARAFAVGFSIGTKGYIGTGDDGVNKKDFWEYNPVLNSWIQKADFGGTGRTGAVGFSIGTKGYIGTGSDGVKKKDFWEYDQGLNTWTQKTDFGGTPRNTAVGISIGTKGYIGLGLDVSVSNKDFWEYDPVLNSWIQKADFGGGASFASAGFSIGAKGYIGNGANPGPNKDFWAYSPSVTYNWSTGATAQSIIASTSGNYNVTVTSVTGCSAISASTLVTATRTLASITSGGPTTFCPGGSVTLTANSGNVWIQKQSLGFTFERGNAVGFSIGNKGYIGTGDDGTLKRKDFWEYDPALNSWTQKADFGGTARNGAVGFSIGTKGYVGTGNEGNLNRKDFWEYDPALNTWTQKTDFDGTERTNAVGFSIGTKGYIGTGINSVTHFKDFWEFDPSTDAWTQKTDFGGTARLWAVGFSINTKGYIGTGEESVTVTNKDFWEYDPVSNTWTQKTNFGGTARRMAVGFGIGTKGYIGTGVNNVFGGFKKDFWEYDPGLNIWTQKADFSGTARNAAVGFSIGTKGYIGTGDEEGTFNRTRDFWEYTPDLTYSWSTGATTQSIIASASGNYTVTVTSNASGCFATSAATLVTVTIPPVATITAGGPTAFCPGGSVTLTANGGNVWTQKASFAGGIRDRAIGFSIGNKGYLGTGNDGVKKKDFWEYDPTTNVWTQKADFGGTARERAVGFSIGSKGYVGTGLATVSTKDFWEYNPVTNSWTQKADFGGTARFFAVGFNIGTKGYIGTGNDGANKNDFWEYDPATDTWTQKANFGGVARFSATGFSIGTKGYIGTGLGGTDKKDFWEYNPATDTWTQKANFAGGTRNSACGFNIGTIGYMGTGTSGAVRQKDIWAYNPATDTWVQKADFGGTGRRSAIAFSIGAKGYIGTGVDATFVSDFWEYTPEITWTWSTGAITQSIAASTSGNYTVTVTDILGCSTTSVATTVTVNSNPTATISAGGPITFCSGGSVTLTATAASSYAWSTGATAPSISATTTGIYHATLTDANGCSAVSNYILIKAGELPDATITALGATNFCLGKDVNLSAVSGNTWVGKGLLSSGRIGASAFSIGNKGYIGLGNSGSLQKDFWEYNPVTNVFTQKADFAGVERSDAISFSIGAYGYIGTGQTFFNTVLNDFWEYNPVTNTWLQKTSLPSTARYSATGFSIGIKGYICSGLDVINSSNPLPDFWEYDQATNTWIQKAAHPFPRNAAVGFSIGTKGYLGTGNIGSIDFWEYNPATNTWLQKANVGGPARYLASGFSIGNKGYIGTGVTGATKLNDFWEYNSLADIWTQKTDVSTSPCFGAVGFSIGNKGYIATGFNNIFSNELSEYTPDYIYSWSNGPATQIMNTDSAGNYTLQVTNQLGCTATSTPTVVTVNTINTWAGGGTNNWNTATNWSCGIVPNHPKVNVVINNGAVPMPQLNSDILVRSLALNGSATVNLGISSLTINGPITGTGNLIGFNTSSLVLKGATGTVNFASGSNSLTDLLLTDTATATLGSPLDIVSNFTVGKVTINANAVLTTNGNLTLKSTILGSSYVAAMAGTITGDVTVERFIFTGTVGGAHAKSWQFLSTPTTGQTIRQSWQENGTTPAGFGTIIVGTGTGFDITTPIPSLKFFNETGVNWTAVTNTNNALQNKLGYMIFVRGDRTVTTSAAAANQTTLRSKGTLFQPSNPPASVPVTANKFQTFGNPYASRIEFSKVRAASTGINDVFYVWDPTLAGSYGLGGYQTISGVAGYIPTVGTPPTGNPATVFYPAGIAAPFIESGQAVFVKGNGTGGNVNFNETVKAAGSRLVNRDPGTPGGIGNRQFLFASLFTNTGLIADGNIVAFENGLSNNVNENDAVKFINAGENFGIRRNDSLLAVEARNNVIETDTIFYQLQNLKQLPYQFRFAPVNMPASLTGFLIDRFLRTSTAISITDSSFVDFTITADDASKAADRFILIFKQSTVVPVKIIYIAADRNPDQSITVQWKVDNEINIDRYEIERSADGRNFIVIGQSTPLNNNGGSAAYIFKDQQPMPDDNFYRIKATGKDGQVQYSDIVKVSAIKQPSSITVYPNPVVDKIINIKFTNQPPGNYMAKLTNKLGQVIYIGPLYINQRNIVKTLQPGNALSTGTYQLSITAADGNMFMVTVFIP
ncbi:hypothetical protein BH11BAC4_BH11BAC4_01340 [soil metagenome]